MLNIELNPHCEGEVSAEKKTDFQSGCRARSLQRTNKKVFTLIVMGGVLAAFRVYIQRGLGEKNLKKV